jgi:hypothetical protein
MDIIKGSILNAHNAIVNVKPVMEAYRLIVTVACPDLFCKMIILVILHAFKQANGMIKLQEVVSLAINIAILVLVPVIKIAHPANKIITCSIRLPAPLHVRINFGPIFKIIRAHLAIVIAVYAMDQLTHNVQVVLLDIFILTIHA